MNLQSLLLILASILMSTTAQLLLKAGMSTSSMRAQLNEGTLPAVGIALATSPWILGGLVAFASSVLIWLRVLSRVDVSQAYPCVALGFVITVAGGYFLLGEPVGVLRVIGTLVIVTGVVIISFS